jgi:CelD/BcsL family acetyltransferase involved in cellulose biosynthesis
MRVHLVHPSELSPAEIAAWQAMQRTSPSLSNPFLSAEFAMAVGRFRPSSQVAVLTQGRSVVGFFPFERRRFGVAVPICGWMGPCQALIHEPGLEWEPQDLLRQSGLSAWKYHNLITGQQPFEPYQIASGAAPIIDLSDGFDAYYAKLQVRSPRFCRELGRKTRKLEREAGELRIEVDSHDASALHALMDWKSHQFRRTRHVDAFDKPWLVGLIDCLLATHEEHVSGLLSILYAGDQPIAGQFGLRGGNLLVGWFTAYDTEFARYSPGLIQIMQMAGKLAGAGVWEIHMGQGTKDYKETLKSRDAFVSEGIVAARSPLGAAVRLRSVSTRLLFRTIRQHPALHVTAGKLLRYTGVARRINGRTLPDGKHPGGTPGCLPVPSSGGLHQQDAQPRQAPAAGRADAADGQPELVGDVRVGGRRIGHQHLEQALVPSRQPGQRGPDDLGSLVGEQALVDLGRVRRDIRGQVFLIVSEHDLLVRRHVAQALVSRGRG